MEKKYLLRVTIRSKSFFKVNLLRYSRIKTLKLLARHGVKFRGTDTFNCYRCNRIKPFQKNFFFPRIYFQGEASQTVLSEEHRNGTLRNRTVADLCAAPGSKSTTLLMCNPEHLYCFEKNRDRYKRLSTIMHRFSSHNYRNRFRVQNTDAVYIHKQYPNFFDFILLDAPCSGVGTTRPSEKQSKIKFLAELQFRLLKSAFWSLKPGGAVKYSVCTCTPEETTGAIEKTLKKFPPGSDTPYFAKLDEQFLTTNDESFYICTLSKMGD
jgi:16S rRNA C967 or C1407 C5-methylase (RsmB/RsmF family)